MAEQADPHQLVRVRAVTTVMTHGNALPKVRWSEHCTKAMGAIDRQQKSDEPAPPVLARLTDLSGNQSFAFHRG